MIPQMMTQCRLHCYLTLYGERQNGERSSGITFNRAGFNYSCMSAGIGHVACCPESMKKCNDCNARSKQQKQLISQVS